MSGEHGPVWGVVLAAGASSRLGGPKALALVDGETFVARAARVLREGGCAGVVVVVSAPHGDAVSGAVSDVVIANNDAPARGMLSSLQIGLGKVRAAGGVAAVVSLLDHPHVASSTVAALVDAWRDSGASVARPVHDGRHGHPYLIDAGLFAALERAPHEEGARPTLKAARASVDVAVDDPAIHEDIDTPEEASARGVRLPQLSRP